MPDVGVRELKTHASQIVRRVREQRVRQVITYRGRPVGLLAPLDEVPGSGETSADAWETLTRLGEEIGQGWCSSQTGADLLSAMRR